MRMPKFMNIVDDNTTTAHGRLGHGPRVVQPDEDPGPLERRVRIAEVDSEIIRLSSEIKYHADEVQRLIGERAEKQADLIEMLAVVGIKAEIAS